MATDRFHVVVVSKYLGMYRARDPKAWAVADHERANSVVSPKFDSETEAQEAVDKLNAGSLVTHADVKDRLLKLRRSTNGA